MSSKSQGFTRILSEVVDEAFSVLGDAPKRALYQYLATVHSLERDDIPQKPKEFSDALRKALGSASVVMQKVILRKLFQRLGHTFKDFQGLEFPDYIADALLRFESTMNLYVDEEPAGASRSKKRQVPG